MIRVARMRDRGEKAFRRIKTQFGLSETYMHEATTYESKMFVAFIALIIVETYRWYIRNELSAISSTTTATTLGELRKFQIQLKPDRTWMPVYAPTKTQKKIFASLNISNQDIEDLVRFLTRGEYCISLIYSDSQVFSQLFGRDCSLFTN